jgi:hypothetical protein
MIPVPAANIEGLGDRVTDGGHAPRKRRCSRCRRRIQAARRQQYTEKQDQAQRTTHHNRSLPGVLTAMRVNLTHIVDLETHANRTPR